MSNANTQHTTALHARTPFTPGTRVWHWDLLAGWNEVVVVSYDANEGQYTLFEDDPKYPFEFEDSGLFVHATADNDAIMGVLIFSPRKSAT